ncbi:serine/threonine-protein kinase [Streptomyces qinzhouensis]|uniref:Serine/threonine protein kinase n=1 Tax=Streptomyces qinzhouensis TaxID=2599401 RepID=A0A5B8IQ46_9ACTN|nr:serine/threonine-protein kinase [Streptomyces qinzhouensis]QDY79729.1 serine/threonine protein kinase [Streptomyces qinzhouensis]
MSGRRSRGTVFQPLGEGDPRHVAGYRLAARLGAGGMGKVYLSYTPGGRPVAIKVIRPDFGQDAEFRRRFAQEVHAAQRVQGLYTAPVIDADPEAEQPWLATAYVPGPSLADAVAEHGALPVETVLLLVAGIAEALQVIHGAGIVHRDLKPANVLLASDGPRVIDFGIARAADATSLTSSGVTIGTPSFMAPEQAAGAQVGPATDIFALGQVAAYASTGRAAFGEGTSHGVLYRIVHEAPDLSQIPEPLVELVTRCLAKEAGDRPSVAEVLTICQNAHAETVLRRPEEWLPGAVAAEIGTRTAAPAPPVTPPPPVPAPPAAAPVTPPPPPAAPPGPAAGHPAAPAAPPPHVPTAASAPATPPPGFGPPPSAATVPGAPYPAQTPAPYPADPAPGLHPAPAPSSPRKKGRTVALAVAATLVVGALAGGGAYIALSGDDGDKDKGSTAASTRTGDAAPAASRPADPAADGAAQDGSTEEPDANAPAETPKAPADEPVDDPKPVKHPEINLVDGYHLTFGDDPLKPVNDDSSEDVFYDWNLDQLEVRNGRLILLRAGQKPELATCRSETRYARSVDLDVLSKGSSFCVLSNSGHVGVVTYQGKSPDSDPSNYVMLTVTTWLNAVDAVQPTS